MRPTKLDLVPRIWEMLFQEVQSEVDRRTARRRRPRRRRTPGDGRAARECHWWTPVLGDDRVRAHLAGTARLVRGFLDIHLINGYGSTEDGVVLVDDKLRRPPVLDYKLVDVPDLGYYGTDRPHPRGELWVKSANVIPGYYKRPEVTAELFDADGWYHTGDVFAETGPDQLIYVDRRNNVLKLSQGEFVTVSKLEAAYGGHPSVRQIFVYGNSARSYLLAVIVPTDDALAARRRRRGRGQARSWPMRWQSVARESGLQAYEIPRDFLIETTPFTLENGSADRHPQAGPPAAQGPLRPRARAALHRPGRRSGRRAAHAAQGRGDPSRARDGRQGCQRAARRGLHRRRTRRPVHRPGRRFVVGLDLRQPAARHLRGRRARSA